MIVCIYEILLHWGTIYPVFEILFSDIYNKYKKQTIHKYNKIVSYIDNTKYGNCIIQWMQSGISSIYSIAFWTNTLIDKGNVYITLFLKKVTTLIYKIQCIKKRIGNYKQKYRDMVEITLDQHNKFNSLNEHMEKTSDELKKINEQLESMKNIENVDDIISGDEIPDVVKLLISMNEEFDEDIEKLENIVKKDN